MSHNTFGHLFRVTTWGESHGPAIGCIVDGCPPRLALAEADIQPWLDRRKPGQSRFTTQRRESDAVRILSGTFEGVTTGTPIALQIENEDARSKDYAEIAQKFRPGHADYTYWSKYGIRDPRGGGRSSARETASRVAAGAIARKVLGAGVVVRGALVQLGVHAIDRARWDWAAVDDNPFFCPDRQAAQAWEGYLDEVRKAGSSCGAVIEIVATGVPAGLGAPIYGKLDADLAAAMMGINAVKGVEIGAGFAAAALSGEANADEMRMRAGQPHFLSNNAGGILGGISTGQDVVLRFAVKPTSSILNHRRTIDVHGAETEIITKGRHDPCVGIRAVPVGEAMMACVLADHLLRHRAQCGGDPAAVKAPELIVRRARAALWAGLLGGLLFLAIGAAFAVHAWQTGEDWLGAGFIFLAGFVYAWQHFDRLRLDPPVVAISDDGLRLPGVGEAPIGWDRIARAQASPGFAFRAGRRIDLEVDAETFVKLRLGQVFLGDAVTKLRGMPYGISIHTRGLDHDAASIFAAIRRHWPPAAES